MGGPSCHHVRRAQHLHLTIRVPACHHVRKAQHLYLTMGGPAYHHVRNSLHLHLTMGGTNPTTMSKGLLDSSLLLGMNLDLENTKLLPEVLKLHSSHF